VVLDDVQRLGWFAEVELVVDSELEIEPARRRVGELSAHLGLQRDESRSYLSMLMELPSG
jgi:adenylate cyclase class 2